MTGETGTNAIADSDDMTAMMEQLEAAAQANDHSAFLAQVKAADWTAHSSDDLVRAIQLALGLNLVWPARDLAEQGQRLFPGHEPLRRAARIFEAPPARMSHNSTPPKGRKESWDWLRDHAHEYHRQWVAVNNGRLLGAAATLEELRTTMRQPDDPNSTIITHVL